MDIPLLNIAHVTKFYSKHDTLPAVDNISFSIYKNRSVALIGESGCGKSTVAKLITGLEWRNSISREKYCFYAREPIAAA